MSIDLLIGFEAPPEMLDSFVRMQGFRFESRRNLDNSGFALTYSYFDNEKSTRGVWFSFRDQAEEEEVIFWRRITQGTVVVATASIWTPMGRSGFDQATQRQICSAIRERFGALIFDPQTNSLLNPIDLERWPTEPGCKAASGLSGSAPPPAVSPGRPNSPTPPQCLPPPIPEGAALPGIDPAPLKPRFMDRVVRFWAGAFPWFKVRLQKRVQHHHATRPDENNHHVED